MKKKTTGKRPTRSRGKPASQRRPRKVAARAKPLRIVDARPKPGHPSPYVAEYAHIAGVMVRGGATDYELARAFGVCVDTIYAWKSRHAEFSESIKGAKAIPIDRAERSLYHRAVGYTHDATKIVVVGRDVVSVAYVEHYPPDTAAARLWLLNCDPLRWRDRHDVALTPPGSKPEQELTDEELFVIVEREQRKRQAALEGRHLNGPGCWCREDALMAAELKCTDVTAVAG